MGVQSTGKQAWLDRIERARSTWEALVAEGGNDLDRPGAAGNWTFKDVAAHLNGWRERTVDRLEAAVRNQQPRRSPWPEELSDETDEGVEAINRWIYERNRDRPAEEILDEARDQFQRLRAAVEAIPHELLTEPGRFPWLGGEALCAVIEGACMHLHEEHEPALRAWLANR